MNLSTALCPAAASTDRPLKVLRPDLSERIAAINAVRKRLAAAGYHISAQDLIGRARPTLILSRGSQRLRDIAVQFCSHGATHLAVIDGVDVIYPAPPSIDAGACS